MRPLRAEVTDSVCFCLDRMNTLCASMPSRLARSMKNTRLPSREVWKTPGATRERSERCS